MRSRARRDPGDSAARLPDTLQFMRLLWATVHGLEKTSKRMRRTIGITGPQRLVLRIVGLAPGITPGALAGILHVHPSTLTGVVARLSARRLLARTHDPVDGRRAVLSLTARGARLNARSHGTPEAAVTRALARLSPQQRRAAHAALAQIVDAIDGA